MQWLCRVGEPGAFARLCDCSDSRKEQSAPKAPNSQTQPAVPVPSQPLYVQPKGLAEVVGEEVPVPKFVPIVLSSVQDPRLEHSDAHATAVIIGSHRTNTRWTGRG